MAARCWLWIKLFWSEWKKFQLSPRERNSTVLLVYLFGFLEVGHWKDTFFPNVTPFFTEDTNVERVLCLQTCFPVSHSIRLSCVSSLNTSLVIWGFSLELQSFSFSMSVHHAPFLSQSHLLRHISSAKTSGYVHILYILCKCTERLNKSA